VTRRYARELALQTLFSIDVGKHDPAEALEHMPDAKAEPENRAFLHDLVLGTLEFSPQSDATIEPLLEGWTLDRLPTVDRLLLRMSVFELVHRPQTPAAVVINEAVELAKKFSTSDSPRFVNGVLSSVAGRPAPKQ
jgi:N utilization substance protein B